MKINLEGYVGVLISVLILKSCMEILKGSIDDIKDMFQQDEDIRTFDVKVSSVGEQRMELVMKQIRERTNFNLDFSSALVYFVFPESHPLLMSEIQPLSEWIESFPSEFMMKWGMATQSSQELRVIVLLQ